MGDRAHLCRAGEISGPGDGTDRYVYWPARFARDSAPAVVPATAGHATQGIGVRDLAAWVLDAAQRRVTGPLNAVGDRLPFGEYIEGAKIVAGNQGEAVDALEDWLAKNYWRVKC
ncbi:hypothetical protein AHiyo4_28420 [Arthrobacter sp. Hiyo4]|nr:hypothetical protein AHiyo4_28420 [Arthrobacter sp. Hiyo4]